MQCVDCGEYRHEGECKSDYDDLVKARDEAFDTYMLMIKNAPPVRERSKAQQSVIDTFLDVYQAFAYKVWHYGTL